MTAPVEVTNCSKWYGQVLGLSEVTWSTQGGVIGLLGPNGAGKSTLIKLIAGLLQPSLGEVRVCGHASFSTPEARAHLGYCPEHDGLYDELTALEFVTYMAELAGVPASRSRDAAAATLKELGLEKAMTRVIRGYSKGMRQRTKLAQALVHDPEVVLLDEPLTGVDPVARAQIMEIVRRLGSSGKTVIVSSHVLHEIEAVTDEILVIHRGQVLAEGKVQSIRELIDQHPHRIEIICDRPRDLAAALAVQEHVARMQFNHDDRVTVETRDPESCYSLIVDTLLSQGIRLTSLTSPDNNLGAVFEYLTTRKKAS